MANIERLFVTWPFVTHVQFLYWDIKILINDMRAPALP